MAILDNGFFANWLQLLDACFFAAESAEVEVDWVLSGREREFNYGMAGEDHHFRSILDDLGPAE